jgi:hypothetical protein
MSQTIQEKNKELVLDAFDTLFNKRDYAAAEKYWPPNYIQHGPHIEPGRDGFWAADAHGGDGKCLIVRAEEKLTAFLELGSAIRP